MPSVQSPSTNFSNNGKILNKNRHHNFVKYFVQCCRRKPSKNFPAELSFMCVWWNAYSAFIPRNLHCPEKFLVVLVFNYENAKKRNISLFVLLGSRSLKLIYKKIWNSCELYQHNFLWEAATLSKSVQVRTRKTPYLDIFHVVQLKLNGH